MTHASLDVAVALSEGDEILDFSLRDGQILNRFFRQGPVAAHMVLTSGTSPRLVVAFPAGNSGVSLWFRPVASPVTWHAVEAVQAIVETNREGESFYGIRSDITVDAMELAVDEAVLSNVRVIRNYLHTRTVADSVRSNAFVEGRTATWYRDRLDGRGGYELAVEVLDGSVAGGSAAPVVFRAADDGVLRLRVTALSGDPPLTPIESGDLLNEDAIGDLPARDILTFLSYREKFLAGSWRFCTYFGRDTLLSLRLLMPVLTGTGIEAGIASVLTRLNPDGEVAHEEDIGEFAVLRRGGVGASDKPLFDYKMVDDDFLLAPVVAHYLLEHPEGRSRATAFLRERSGDGQTHGTALARNFRFVLTAAEPFGREPTVDNLIRLKEGERAGEWRDSDEGLGFGRIPYDVNAILVPAALTAIARLHTSGLLGEYAAGDDFAAAAALARTWEHDAPPFFAVTIPYARARRNIIDYAAATGIPDSDALASLADGEAGGQEEVTFNAVSLDEQGHAIPILNSDDGFALLFGDLPAAELERSLSTLLRPFPAGLLTPVGLVVANPAYAPAEMWRHFTNGHYHGAVVWSWQQALLAAGLERQLRRTDLPVATRRILSDAQTRLWRVISSTKQTRNAELWSWSYAQGGYRVEPFGQRSGDRTESNAAQLWSTVYLAITPP